MGFSAESFLLVGACFIGWMSIDTIIPKREVLIVGSGRGGQAAFDEMADSPVYNVVGVLDDDFVGTGRCVSVTWADWTCSIRC